MIKVTVWNEYVQETATEEKLNAMPVQLEEQHRRFLLENAEKIK